MRHRNSLGWYIAKRLVASCAVVLVASMVIFALLYAAPGSAEETLAGPKASSEQIELVSKEYHLNESVPMQYLHWLGGALHLEFGDSLSTKESVWSEITARAPVTIELGLLGFLIAFGLGVPLGVMAAVRSRTAFDRAVVGLSIVGVSAPAFATGLFLLYVFGLKLEWFPVLGGGEGSFADRLSHLVLPACAVALVGLAPLLKLTRAATLDTLESDYVTFAEARGIPIVRIWRSYALRNALVPVVTVAAGLLSFMLTGVALVEITFSINGLGALLVNSVTKRDIPTLQALTLLVAVVVVAINFFTDLLYLVIDPRIRLGSGAEA